VKRLALLAVVVLAAIAVALNPSSSGSGSSGYQVRAIFSNAAFAVPGEQVRIAGASVGSIRAVSVTKQNQAAVTISVNSRAFTPFHANATCDIRPQSLIAERYIDCDPGTRGAPVLARIRRGAGAGTHLLPVTQTSAAIAPDIVQDISQESIRERLSIILDELGTGLAARGADLNSIIVRADPALGQTDQVFKILASENRVLARLATDGDAVLGPLAKVHQKLADFIVQANRTAVASAARTRDISRSFALLPGFLKQLRPLMVQLGNLAGQGTPLMASLAQSALATDRQFANLIPFAKAARPALIALGNSAQKSQPALVSTQSLANRLNRLGTAAVPSAASLDRLTSSLNSTGAIEQLMSVLFYGTGASNGFDSDGHYVRTEPLVGSCTSYQKKQGPGCSAGFTGSASATAAAAVAATARTSAQATASLSPGEASVAKAAVKATLPSSVSSLVGLMRYLVGSGK
jgi:ABC-type transporter Mla subunit MlaD